MTLNIYVRVCVSSNVSSMMATTVLSNLPQIWNLVIHVIAKTKFVDQVLRVNGCVDDRSKRDWLYELIRYPENATKVDSQEMWLPILLVEIQNISVSHIPRNHFLGRISSFKPVVSVSAYFLTTDKAVITQTWPESHAGTVVPECFKDHNTSQWKSGKFDPRSLRNPWTDRHQNLHGWLRWGPLPLCKISSR